jgi:hypothetical protein
MTRNFIREENLDDDAVVDGVKNKVRFESIMVGTGDPSAPPAVPEKSWAYFDITDDENVVGFVWDPDDETWLLMSAGPGGTGATAWDPIVDVVADNATVTMVQPGAAYIIPRTSGNTRGLLDCTDLLASPGVEALVIGAASTDSTATGTTTYGPSVYVPVSQPAWIADLLGLFSAITVTDYTGSPVDLVFTAPNVTVTLDADYTDATGVGSEIVAQLNAARACTVVQLPNIIRALNGPYFAALKSTATGDAVTFAFNPGASTPGELTDWFALDAEYIDGWTDYPVGLNGRNVGTGELGVSTTTHLWTDDTDMDYVHVSRLASFDGATIQATVYKFRPGSISYTPSTEANWPERDFGDTPANFNLDQALDILAARQYGWKEDILRSNFSGTAVDVGAAAGTAGSATLFPTSNDAAGGVGVTTDVDATSGEVATVTLDTAFPWAATVIIAPADPQAAALSGVYAVVDSVPVSSFTIHSVNPLPASTELEWAYHLIGQPD